MPDTTTLTLAELARAERARRDAENTAQAAADALRKAATAVEDARRYARKVFGEQADEITWTCGPEGADYSYSTAARGVTADGLRFRYWESYSGDYGFTHHLRLLVPCPVVDCTANRSYQLDPHNALYSLGWALATLDEGRDAVIAAFDCYECSDRRQAEREEAADDAPAPPTLAELLDDAVRAIVRDELDARGDWSG